MEGGRPPQAKTPHDICWYLFVFMTFICYFAFFLCFFLSSFLFFLFFFSSFLSFFPDFFICCFSGSFFRSLFVCLFICSPTAARFQRFWGGLVQAMCILKVAEFWGDPNIRFKHGAAVLRGLGRLGRLCGKGSEVRVLRGSKKSAACCWGYYLSLCV